MPKCCCIAIVIEQQVCNFCITNRFREMDALQSKEICFVALG